MELPVPSQESEVFIFPLSTIFRLDFGFSFSIITSLREIDRGIKNMYSIDTDMMAMFDYLPCLHM